MMAQNEYTFNKEPLRRHEDKLWLAESKAASARITFTKAIFWTLADLHAMTDL